MERITLLAWYCLAHAGISLSLFYLAHRAINKIPRRWAEWKALLFVAAGLSLFILIVTQSFIPGLKYVANF